MSYLLEYSSIEYNYIENLFTYNTQINNFIFGNNLKKSGKKNNFLGMYLFVWKGIKYLFGRKKTFLGGSKYFLVDEKTFLLDKKTFKEGAIFVGWSILGGWENWRPFLIIVFNCSILTLKKQILTHTIGIPTHTRIFFPHTYLTLPLTNITSAQTRIC